MKTNSPLSDLKEVNKLYTTLSSSFALIPGTAIMLAGIAVPPGISKFLFGGLVEVFGVVILILLLVNRHHFVNQEKKKITQKAILLGLISFLAILFYFFIYSSFVIDHPLYDPILFPILDSGILESSMNTLQGNKYEAIEKYGYQGVADMINSSSKSGETLTYILMMIIYNLIFIPIILIFGMLGFHLSVKINQN